MENNINSEIKSPIDLLKKDFKDFISEQLPLVSNKLKIGQTMTITIPENVKPPLNNRVLLANDKGFYYSENLFSKDKNLLKITMTLNAKLVKIKPYIKVHNNKTNNPTRALIHLIFETDIGELTEPVILDEKAKSNYKEFNIALNRVCNRILAKFDENSFLLFMEYLNEQEQHTIYALVNPGKVLFKNLSGRLYENAYADEGDIILANEYGEVKIDDKYLTLDKSKLANLPKLYTGEYNVKEELFKLMSQTDKIYKGKIEPFICLGTAVMCIYLEEIWENLAGFPIIYLQGHTKQGKSLIQGVVMNIYGYGKKQIATGNSTDNAIAMKCHSLNSVPICINDYDGYKAQSSSFENNIVHFYESGIREKMYNGKDFNLQPISSTAIYSSNYMPCVKEKIFNRLLPLYFPDNGLDTQEITNSYVNDIKRSRILIEVQKYGWEKISNLIEKTEKFILNLNVFKAKDRESNNIAIALSGILILEVISGYKIKDRDELVKEYCQWYRDFIEKSVTVVDQFLNSLQTLYYKKYLKLNHNFKLELIDGRIIFSFATQECIQLYNSFFSQEGFVSQCINARNFAYDLKASPYFVGRETKSYRGGKQASSTILDITDSINGKYFYYAVTGAIDVAFSEELYKKKK